MKVGIITFEQFHGKMDIGSSRIRGEWVAKYWPEAEVYKMGGTYDVIIYQKVYWIEHAQQFQGVKILDICDPDWLHWGNRVKQMIDLCDAVTTSTLEIAKYLVDLTDKPVWFIPDRLDPEIFNVARKVHTNDHATTAVWYGYSENFPVLTPAIPSLIKNGIKTLIVIASRRSPYRIPKTMEGKIEIINYPWTLETVNDDIKRGDFVLNPKITKARFRYKSNNKTINAYALGMPVAHTESELRDLIDPVKRKKIADENYEMVKKDYNVLNSAIEYQNLIKEIYEHKKGIITNAKI